MLNCLFSICYAEALTLLVTLCLSQRDFSVYLVNVFDTAVAARTLAIPGGASLANLLSFYLKKQKDRKMQLADWRVRCVLRLDACIQIKHSL